MRTCFSLHKMESSFEKHCRDRFIDFSNRYEHFIEPGFRQELVERNTAADLLSYVNMKASFLHLNLYLIIDEYDNFTNTILSTYGTSAYAKASDAIVTQTIGKAQLKLITVVFRTWEVVAMEEVEPTAMIR